MIFLEDIGDLFLVLIDGDLVDRLHQFGQGRAARGAQQAADRHPPDGAVERIDHIDVEEQLRQVVALFADVVDGVAHAPELGRGHHLALHQAAGGLLIIAQAALDRGAVDVRHGRQNAFALVVLKVLDHGGGVIGIQFLQGLGQGAVRHPLQHLFPNPVVQFGQGLGQQLRRQPQHHDGAVFRRQEAHQVGDVGGVQILEQRTQPHAVAVVGGVHDFLDELRGEDIVLVQGGVVFVIRRFGWSEGGVRGAHVVASLGRMSSRS